MSLSRVQEERGAGPRSGLQALIQIHPLEGSVTVGTAWADLPHQAHLPECGRGLRALREWQAEVSEMQKNAVQTESGQSLICRTHISKEIITIISNRKMIWQEKSREKRGTLWQGSASSLQGRGSGKLRPFWVGAGQRFQVWAREVTSGLVMF